MYNKGSRHRFLEYYVRNVFFFHVLLLLHRCFSKDSQIPSLISTNDPPLCNEKWSDFVSKCCDDSDYCNNFTHLQLIQDEGTPLVCISFYGM